MLTKDGRDTPIERLTADNYIVPKGEERAYHAVIEVTQFDSKTGRRISKPRVQKFGKKAFDSHVRESLRKQGYDVRILHDPTEWIKGQRAQAAARAKADAEAKEKAEQAKFDAAVDAAVNAKLDAAVQAAVAKALADREKAEKAAQTAEKVPDGEQPQPEPETAAKGRKKAKEQE